MTKASLSNQVTQEASKQIPPKTSKVVDHTGDRYELPISSHDPAIKKLQARTLLIRYYRFRHSCKTSPVPWQNHKVLSSLMSMDATKYKS